MSKYVTEQQFKQWVENYYQEFCRRNDFVAYAFGAGNPKHKGIIIINRDNGKVARSRCHPDDMWDWETGVAVAYAHYMGIEVPQVEKNYFIKDLVGKEVMLPAIYGNIPTTTVFVTPYIKGGYIIVVDYMGCTRKVLLSAQIPEHNIKK